MTQSVMAGTAKIQELNIDEIDEVSGGGFRLAKRQMTYCEYVDTYGVFEGSYRWGQANDYISW